MPENKYKTLPLFLITTLDLPLPPTGEGTADPWIAQLGLDSRAWVSGLAAGVGLGEIVN